MKEHAEQEPMAAQTASPSDTEAVPTADTARAAWLSDWRVQTALVMLVALAVRLIYLFQMRQWPFFYSPVLDSSTQYQWAQEVLHTPALVGSARVLAKPPLYTYFLAMCIWLLGDGKAALFGAHLLQLVLGAFTSGLIYLIGRRTFGVGAGLIAGLLYAVYSQGLFNEGELLDSALSTALAAALLLALLAALEAPTVARWFGVGVLLGLLGLARGNLLLLGLMALALLVWWVRRGREPEEVRAMAIALVGGTALMILPITARNALIGGEFIPISTNAGINLYTGNNPEADGYSPILAGYQWERSWYQWMAGGPMSLKKQDQFWQRQALRFWREHPGRALALTVKKVYLYWNAYEVPNNLGYGWGRGHSSLLRTTLPFAVLAPLGLLGMMMGWRRNRASRVAALFVLAAMASTVVFFVAGRYRMAMMPALLPFAGLAVTEVAAGVRARHWRPLTPVLVTLVLCAAFVNTDLYGVRRAHGAERDAYLLGESYMNQGDLAHAAGAFRLATEQHPDDPDAWLGWARMEEMLGRAQQAADLYRRTLQVAPGYARPAAWLADLAMQQGWPLEEPRRLLETALKGQYRSAQGWIALTQLDLRRGDKQAVAADLEKLAPVWAGLASWGKGYDQMQQSLSALVAAASAKGVPVPPSLFPSTGSGGRAPPQLQFEQP
jgi:4-amino-4-deoxy-L-arabinose transferase-like glycosyltransferase